MSNQEFENYLRLIGKLLRLSQREQQQIAGELRDHLDLRVADLEDEGLDYDKAVRCAIDEFGDAAVMAQNFRWVSQLKRRRWMMRFATLATAACFVFAVFLMAMWPSNARFGTPEIAMGQETDAPPRNVLAVKNPLGPSSTTRRNETTEELLKRPASMMYDEVPWRDIEEELERNYKVNFILSHSAQDDSLTEDEPITIDIRNVPLEKALILLLSDKNATYYLDEGIVVIISLDDAPEPEYMRVKMFNCRSLIEKLDSNIAMQNKRRRRGGPGGMSAPGRGGSPGMGLGAGPGGGGPGLGGPGGGAPGMGGLGGPPQGMGMMGGMGDDDDDYDGGIMLGGMGPSSSNTSKYEQMLLELVESMITPDDWVSTNGTANARMVNGVLIVKHQQSAFRQIESLLNDLMYQLDSGNGIDDMRNRIGGISPRSPSSSQRPRMDQPDPFGGSADDNSRDPFGSNDPENPFGGRDPFGNSPGDDLDPFGQ